MRKLALAAGLAAAALATEALAGVVGPAPRRKQRADTAPPTGSAPADEDEAPPPRKLTSDPNKPHYHPSCLRVGVRIDGEACNDCIAYDQDANTYTRNCNRIEKTGTIEVYWRWKESRQERRARERWEASHRAS